MFSTADRLEKGDEPSQSQHRIFSLFQFVAIIIKTTFNQKILATVHIQKPAEEQTSDLFFNIPHSMRQEMLRLKNGSKTLTANTSQRSNRLSHQKQTEQHLLSMMRTNLLPSPSDTIHE